MHLFLSQRCDLRGTCAAHLPIVLSWILCFPILRQVLRGNVLVFYKALLLASEISNFLRAFFMVCLNSSSFGSMKKIPRNCLALSSFDFSIAHFCFALLVAACFHISGQTLVGLEDVSSSVSPGPCISVRWPFVQ